MSTAVNYFNPPKFNVGQPRTEAEKAFYAENVRRSEIKAQIASMMSELIKTDLDAWARMHEYSHNHGIEQTLDELMHEFDRLVSLSERAEITSMRIG
jgi:hypothetical protein